MKKYLILVLLTAMVWSAGMVLAQRPGFQSAKVTNPQTGEPKNTVSIPATAVEVAPNIFYLGTATDKGRQVEGYAFVDYKKGYGKPTSCNNDGKCQGWEDPSCADCAGGGGGDTGASSCYGFLAKGAKWRTVENYGVAGSDDEVTTSFMSQNIAKDIGKWEAAAGQEIIASESQSVDGVDTDNPDDRNEVLFGIIDEPGAIAVTIVWGVFNGPPFQRQLVEWDQIYDVEYNWNADAVPDADEMDFENIATHELGHAVGLDDLYEDKCSEQTMYGYAGFGETKKRDLGSGDIAGVQELYK